MNSVIFLVRGHQVNGILRILRADIYWYGVWISIISIIGVVAVYIDGIAVRRKIDRRIAEEGLEIVSPAFVSSVCAARYDF